MKISSDFDQVDLILLKGKIQAYADVSSGLPVKGLPKSTCTKGIYKLYVLMEKGDFLYVGTTSRRLSERIWYGLSANGKNGYHGYKWKQREKVRLLVWLFADIKKEEVEAIEAELAYQIREKTGFWPLAQNEIHFNNEFLPAKKYAESIFQCLKEMT